MCVDMTEQIESILNEKVRPTLRLHGGDMRVLGVEGGVMKFSMQGACAQCPSAYLTSEALVKEAILTALPDINDVLLVQDVSDDMLDMARKILSHG